jgi:hypothetical protein
MLGGVDFSTEAFMFQQAALVSGPWCCDFDSWVALSIVLRK